MRDDSETVGGRGTPFSGDSLVALLEHRAAVQPADTAYTFLRDGDIPAATLTWAELDRASRMVCGWLRARTLPGDRALLLYQPGLEFIAAFFGCLYADVLAVPTVPPRGGRTRQGADRLASIAADALPRCTLATQRVIDQLTRDASDGLIDPTQLGACVATDALPPGLSAPPRDGIGRGTLAFLQYTSGSTANPRGVMVSHGNLLHNLTAAFHLGDGGPDSVSVSWLPVTHDMGLIDGVLQPAFSGCPAYLMSPGAFLQRPVHWLRALSTYRATRSGGPNFAYDLAVTRVTPAEREGLDLSAWRAAYNGAEPVRHDTMRAFATAYRPAGFKAEAFRPCYGLAEATLLVTTGRWSLEKSEADPVSCGAPAFATGIRIVDPVSRALCRDAEPGEIQVSGDSVAHGYWNRPEDSARTFGSTTRDPWLRTGDLGFLYDGELHVTGRIKDLLIVRGAKHFPQDLERTAMGCHPAVRPGGVAAVAVGSGVRGDRIALIAEVDPHQFDQGALVMARLRQAIAETHGIQLEGIALLAPGGVPKTTSGKLRRFLCRHAWIGGTLDPLASWNATAPSAVEV